MTIAAVRRLSVWLLALKEILVPNVDANAYALSILDYFVFLFFLLKLCFPFEFHSLLHSYLWFLWLFYTFFIRLFFIFLPHYYSLFPFPVVLFSFLSPLPFYFFYLCLCLFIGVLEILLFFHGLFLFSSLTVYFFCYLLFFSFNLISL